MDAELGRCKTSHGKCPFLEALREFCSIETDAHTTASVDQYSWLELEGRWAAAQWHG